MPRGPGRPAAGRAGTAGPQGQVAARRARLDRGDRRHLARPPGRDGRGDRDGEDRCRGDQHRPGAGQRRQRSPAMPVGGRTNAGDVATRATASPSPAPATPSNVCSAISIRTTWPGVNPSALSIAMSWRCISTRRRGDVGDRARRGYQRDDAEQREQQPEQPVVARHRLLDLLPGGERSTGRRSILVRAVVDVPDVLHDLAGGHGGVVRTAAGRRPPRSRSGSARPWSAAAAAPRSGPASTAGRSPGRRCRRCRSPASAPAVPSMPSTAILFPTPTCTAAANDASRTAPSGAEDRSQVPATTSGAEMAGRARASWPAVPPASAAGPARAWPRRAW